jgi:small subunit ribosomal protein S16
MPRAGPPDRSPPARKNWRRIGGLRRIRALFWASHAPLREIESDKIMVTIRLTRRGARNQPFYHVVVTDSRKRQGGPSLEHVGYFNPIARRSETKLKLDLPRIDYWIGKGALPSDRVRTLVASYRKQATA